MDKTSLGDRMKSYEDINRTFLTPRMPAIIRVDGRSFSTYTKGFERPFDQRITDAMTAAAKQLVSEISGASIAYIQSDEISVLITDYQKFSTQAWFGKNVQKIVSVSASIATAYFNNAIDSDKIAQFDSRCFCIPSEDVVNYFVWRQRDAIRNSILMHGYSKFSHKELHANNTSKVKEKLLSVGLDWHALPTTQRQGWCVKVVETDGRSFIEVDHDIPEFSQGRSYIQKHIDVREE